MQNGTLNPGKVLSGSQTCMTRNIHASLSDAVTKATNTYFCFLDPREHGMIVFQPFISSSGFFFSCILSVFFFVPNKNNILSDWKETVQLPEKVACSASSQLSLRRLQLNVLKETNISPKLRSIGVTA